MSACPTIETERLIMRPFRESDLAAYTSVLQSEGVRRSLHLPDDVDEDAAWREMALWLGQWELRGTGHWAIEVKATGRLVGRVGLHRPQRRDWPGVECGWSLHPDVWGEGYATEAGARAVRYGFEELGQDLLYSLILPENERSQAVARRLGFTFLELRTLSFFPSRPHGLWRLTAEEWEARGAEP